MTFKSHSLDIQKLKYSKSSVVQHDWFVLNGERWLWGFGSGSNASSFSIKKNNTTMIWQTVFPSLQLKWALPQLWSLPLSSLLRSITSLPWTNADKGKFIIKFKRWLHYNLVDSLYISYHTHTSANLYHLSICVSHISVQMGEKSYYVQRPLLTQKVHTEFDVSNHTLDNFIVVSDKGKSSNETGVLCCQRQGYLMSWMPSQAGNCLPWFQRKISGRRREWLLDKPHSFWKLSVSQGNQICD